MSADALDEIDVVDVEGIADDSTTNTFVAARLWIDTDRWRGVPSRLSYATNGSLRRSAIDTTGSTERR
jgi:glucose-6-phosphate 1-dehydrogenase